MAITKQESTYVCIRDCFCFNKHFIEGDPFPETWYRAGYEVPHHFALRADAEIAFAEAKKERMMFGPGDDPRSTEQLKKDISKFVKDIPEKWTRKQIWIELRRYENAEGKETGGIMMPKEDPPKKKT